MATVMDTRVVMVFRHHAQAQRAIDALLDAGVDREDITLSEPGADVLRQIEAAEEAERTTPPDPTAPFAGVGALVGAVVGGLVGWLARPFRGWGAWNAAFGAAAGSALGSGAGAFVARRLAAAPADAVPDVPLEPIHRDEGSLERGRAMVTVEPGTRGAECEEILRSFGGRRPGHAAPDRRPPLLDAPTRPDDPTTVFPTVDAGAPAEAAVAEQAVATGLVAGDPLEAEVEARREALGASAPEARDRI